MPYHFVADNIHTAKLCSGLSSGKCNFTQKTAVFEPILESLEAMYAVHLRLIGKLVVDFILVITEHFCSFYG